MSKMVKKRVVHALSIGRGKDRKDYEPGQIVELSDENAEIFKSRLADPSEVAEAADPRTKAAQYKKEIEELKAEIEQLKAGDVGTLMAQNKALLAENQKLKAAQ